MKKTEKKESCKVFTASNIAESFLSVHSVRSSSKKFWRWGDDNLFPAALALMSRRSTTHRRIINDKADYISGKGFIYDTTQVTLGEFVGMVNGSGETMQSVSQLYSRHNKNIYDLCLDLYTQRCRVESWICYWRAI